MERYLQKCGISRDKGLYNRYDRRKGILNETLVLAEIQNNGSQRIKIPSFWGRERLKPGGSQRKNQRFHSNDNLSDNLAEETDQC